MRHLYRVEVEVTMYVIAEDDDEAGSLARENIQEEVFNQEPWVRKVRRHDALDANWCNAIPWGATDDCTVTHYQSLIPETEADVEAAGQLRLDAGDGTWWTENTDASTR